MIRHDQLRQVSDREPFAHRIIVLADELRPEPVPRIAAAPRNLIGRPGSGSVHFVAGNENGRYRLADTPRRVEQVVQAVAVEFQLQAEERELRPVHHVVVRIVGRLEITVTVVTSVHAQRQHRISTGTVSAAVAYVSIYFE